jgi:prevent-host-death family protein
MKTYTITESKAQLSSLVKQVMETGEMVIIGKHGQPMVKLSPYRPKPNAWQRLGAFKGQIKLSKDYDEWDDEESHALGIQD